eukprot:6768539-Alexandrium_andersonii.AAC.1
MPGMAAPRRPAASRPGRSWLGSRRAGVRACVRACVRSPSGSSRCYSRGMLAWDWAGLGRGELVERGVPVASWGGLARAVRARLRPG